MFNWIRGAITLSLPHVLILALRNMQTQWIFVSDRDFVRANVRSHRLPRSSNSVSLRSSTRVTAYSFVGGHIVNRSIDPARI